MSSLSRRRSIYEHVHAKAKAEGQSPTRRAGAEPVSRVPTPKGDESVPRTELRRKEAYRLPCI